MLNPIEIDHVAFWNSINQSPLDDAPKLVYADWLDEHGFSLQATIFRWVGMTGRSPTQGDGRRFDGDWFFGSDYDLWTIEMAGNTRHCVPKGLAVHFGWRVLRADTPTNVILLLTKPWEMATTSKPLSWLWSRFNWNKESVWTPSFDRVAAEDYETIKARKVIEENFGG